MYHITAAGLFYTTTNGICIEVDGLGLIKPQTGRNEVMMANHYIKPLQHTGRTHCLNLN